jgi:soluble lytic murein transglycosylase-like protein
MRFLATIAILSLLLALTTVGTRAADLKGATGEIDEHALFRAIGAMYGFDPELLEAIAEVESGGRSDAVSEKGAIGLMQLMPGTAARYRVRDARDPVENALGAARYLAHLRDATVLQGTDKADLSRILAAYNAGEGAVFEYNGIPPFPETEDYVGRVLWVYLMGPSAPRPVALFPARRSAEAGRKTHHSDGDVLHQLDSLRRARESAVAEKSK